MNKDERIAQMWIRFAAVEKRLAEAKGQKPLPMETRIERVEGRDDSNMPIGQIPVTIDEVRHEAHDLESLIEYQRDEQSAREALTSDEL